MHADMKQERIGELLDVYNTPFSANIPGLVERRQQAGLELMRLGLTAKQVESSIKVRRALGAGRTGRTAGGIVGAIGTTAIAGRLIPGPFDDAGILAALIAGGGAGIGGVTGDAIQTGIEEKRMLGKYEALKSFGIEAGTELGGRGIVRAGKFALSPFIKQTVPEAAALIDDFAKFGGHFSPTELDKRFTLRIGEAFSRGSFGAKEIFQEFEERQGKAVLAYADSIINSISDGVARQTPEQIGQVFAQGITKPGGRVFNLLDDLFDPLYAQLDDLTKSSIVEQTAKISVPSTILDQTGKPFTKTVERVIGERISGTGVSTKSLKTFRAKIIAQNQRLVDFAKRTGKELPLVSPAGKTILDDINNLPKFVGHADYRAFRTKALRETRKLNRDVDVSEGMVKSISSITRKELLDPQSIAGASPQAKRLHANISSLYTASREGLEETFPEELAKRLLQNPSNIVREVLPKKNPTAIRLLRESLVEPISGHPSAQGKVLWNQLRQQWLAGVVDEASKEGVASPRVMNRMLRNMGREAFEEMFPEPAIRANVEKIPTMFAIAGKAAPSGASLFSRGAQTLGVVKLWQGAQVGNVIGMTQGGILSIGPLAFAKLATHPTGVKLLTAGFKMKPGASGIVPNTIRMAKLLRSMEAKENKTRARALEAKIRSRRMAQTREPRTPSYSELRGFGGRGF